MKVFHYRATIQTNEEVMTVRLSEPLFLQLLKLMNGLQLHLFREITPKSYSEICFCFILALLYNKIKYVYPNFL
jgi:hypothetical protein